jgi:PhnB protein
MTTASENAAAHGMHVLSPHLTCAGAAAAIDFYKAAFGATEYMRLAAPTGKLIHASIAINGSSVMLVDEHEDQGLRSPQKLGGTPVTIHLMVDDVDAAIATAASAGATVVMPAADMFWGDRYGVIEDPFGHRWSLATPTGKAVDMQQLQEAARGAECGAAS